MGSILYEKKLNKCFFLDFYLWNLLISDSKMPPQNHSILKAFKAVKRSDESKIAEEGNFTLNSIFHH